MKYHMTLFLFLSFIMGHSMGGCISTYLASRIINGGLGISAQTDPSSLKVCLDLVV